VEPVHVSAESLRHAEVDIIDKLGLGR